MFALVHLHFIRRGRTNEQLGKRVKRKDADMAKWVNVFGRFVLKDRRDAVIGIDVSTRCGRESDTAAGTA